MKLYAAIASTLNAQARNKNKELQARLEERLEALLDALPSGSGFDRRATAEPIEGENPRRAYRICGGYQPIGEHGTYEPWIDFSIRVFAQEDLCLPWDIESETDAPEAHLEFILDTYAEALNAEAPT